MVDRKKLEEIIAGCEGVTPGPWVSSTFGTQVLTGDSWNSICIFYEGRRNFQLASWEDGRRASNPDANAAHIARLDPQTVKAIAERIIELEDAAKEAAKALDALSLGRSVHNDRFPNQRIDGGVWTAAAAALKRLLALEKETHDAE